MIAVAAVVSTSVAADVAAVAAVVSTPVMADVALDPDVAVASSAL